MRNRVLSGGLLPLAILLLGITLALPFFSILTSSRDYVFSGWSLGILVFGCAPIYRRLSKDFDGFTALAFFYFVASALYVACYENNRYAFSPTTIKTYFSYSSFYFLLALVTLSQYRAHPYMLWFFPTIGVMNALYTTVGAVFGFSKLSDGYGYSGIIDYPSLNGVLTVVCFFISLGRTKHLPTVIGLGVLVLLSVLASKSSTPLGALVVGVVAYNCTTVRRVALSLGLGAILLAVGYYLDPQLFNPQGRLDAWKVFFDVWEVKFPLLFGSGPGTFSSLAIETQQAKNYMVGYYYLFLHNEWLQVLYETGFIGFIFVVGIFLKALYKSFKRSDHSTTAALVSFGAASLLVFPLRYFWGALLAAHLVCLGFGGSCAGRRKDFGDEN